MGKKTKVRRTWRKRTGSGSSTTVAIVGCGFGGLAAAIELKRNGYEDFVIFERASSIGGVWRDNTYPGAACDVPSAIYSFSFALKPDWSALFGKQDEICSYLEKVADEFDITRHIEFDTEVTAADYDESTAKWQVSLSTGRAVVADIVIMATGQLSRPKMPAVPGIETFEGPSFHSAEWDHDVDLTGKRVAVVGSGASAIQVVPAIADQVAEMTVLQRSPNWVMWKSRRRPGAFQTSLMRYSKLLRKLHHNVLFLAYETRYPLVLRLANPVRKLSQWWLIHTIKKHVSDPAEVRAAIPKYRLLCNRLLLSNDWYPTIGRDNVHLVGSAVTAVDPEGITVEDGRHVNADVIVWCTGFKASEFLVPIKVQGRDGRDLHSEWANGASAYLGMTYPGFPNFFMLFGPNTNSITNTIVFLLERQARYIRMAIDHKERSGDASIEVSTDTYERFQGWLDGKLQQTVFTDSCPGWYTNEDGKVTAMWPASHLAYARATADFKPHEYVRELTPVTGPVLPASVKSPDDSTEEAESMTEHDTTICELFDRTVQQHPDQRALSEFGGEGSYTYREYQNAVAETAAKLHGLGVRHGDVVLLMFDNRPEFHVIDLAATHLGATTCSAYNTLPPADIAYVVSDASPRLALCEEKYAPQLVAGVDGAVPVYCTTSGVTGTEAFEDQNPAADFDFEAAWRAVRSDDVLTLIYTSGTTGNPKGVELTHAAMVADLVLAGEILDYRAGDRVPSAMPMAHAAQRWGTHYGGIAFGLDVTCVPDITQLVASLQEVHPDIWGTVPRILEKIVAGLQARFAAEPDENKRAAIDGSFKVGQAVAEAKRAGTGIPAELEAQYEQATPVLGGIRALLGLENLRWLVVGAAPTPRHVLDFFAALGIEVVEVWGMTELGAVATVNPIGAQKFGTVGRPLRSVDIRLADDGEVLVKGPIAMRGYRGKADLTNDAFDESGYLKTGDIGVLDDDGFLSIVDRKKEIIINASGKNISPQRVEAAIKAQTPLAGSVVAIGDSRPYLTALIVLDPDAAKAFGDKVGIDGSDLAAVVAHPALQAHIDEAVARANENLARVEQVKRHSVLSEVWLPGGEELTPTMKLRRKPIEKRYDDAIDSMYTSEPAR
ncbi:AMP-binding protein [Gordonia rubripertincta]|uniref:AMP-binding protein n=1 Tax=Gordonia rubripertincta TaxID=36822 RepID=UPI000B8D30EA|nr:AMP-binding protein [Gordonia rubripertincta]ASR01203.1 4-hydroxyacetophenone monooxygenase [Gordonia rubripertincta]